MQSKILVRVKYFHLSSQEWFSALRNCPFVGEFVLPTRAWNQGFTPRQR